jgi:cobalt transporter subunit CbtB
MNAQNQTRAAEQSRARFIPAVFAAVFGLAMITITGHVQAAALHDAAHDVRHATGFPCH